MSYAGKMHKKRIGRGRSKRQFRKSVLRSHRMNDAVMRGGTAL